MNVTHTDRPYSLTFLATATHKDDFIGIDETWFSAGDCTVAPPPTINPVFPGGISAFC